MPVDAPIGTANARYLAHEIVGTFCLWAAKISREMQYFMVIWTVVVAIGNSKPPFQ